MAWRWSAARSKCGGNPAIDIQDVTIYESRRVTGQEYRGTSEVFYIAPAAAWGAAYQPCTELLIRHQLLGEFSFEITRPQPIDIDPIVLLCHKLSLSPIQLQ